jgi:hypothetical protein
MLKGFLCLLFLAVLMTAAVGSDEQLPELHIQIIAGGSVTPKYSVSIEGIQGSAPDSVGNPACQWYLAFSRRPLR